jgi:hypothetical protein
MDTKEKVNNLDELLKATEDIDTSEKRRNWAGFVETTAVNFLVECKLEKITLEDGLGNKAKLARQKNDSIKVEYTSTTLL